VTFVPARTAQPALGWSETQLSEVVSTMVAGSLHSAALYRRLAADVSILGLSAGQAGPPPVTEDQLGGLPCAAQRYLRFMGVVGRPADWSFLAHVTGRFRLRPGLPWMRCQAWQYNDGPSVARLFHMRIDAASVLPMTGRDAYANGHGRLLAKLAGLVNVADSAGPETDMSELVTYLNDAVFLAPSMLLVPAVRWAGPGEMVHPGQWVGPGERQVAAPPRCGHLAPAQRALLLRDVPVCPRCGQLQRPARGHRGSAGQPARRRGGRYPGAHDAPPGACVASAG
jgi:hypothetical protein